MNRETHVRFCEGLGCNSLGLLTYGRSEPTEDSIVQGSCLRRCIHEYRPGVAGITPWRKAWSA